MQKKIIFHLETDTSDLRPVYLTGTFNGWNPMSEAHKMTKLEGKKAFYFELLVDDSIPIEYKYTRGGWENVEMDAHQNIAKNRSLPDHKLEVYDKVKFWRNNWAPYKREFEPIVKLVSDEFYIPQLKKSRRVWALLPHDYETSEKRYPVLYLQDAQNLFHGGSAYGNWEIDMKMAVLSEYGRGDIIIVAIEHGEDDRLREYIFEDNTIVERGEGKKYIRFVTDTLKPYIDANFRTKPEREDTGIGGSSLGALISLFGGFFYPEVYSKLMIFSPSLWVFPKISFPQLQFYNPFETKIYIYGGAKEGSRMTEKIHEFVDKMEEFDSGHSSSIKFKVSINPRGEHKEYYWSQEFPKAIEWLFYENFEDPTLLLEQNKVSKQI